MPFIGSYFEAIIDYNCLISNDFLIVNVEEIITLKGFIPNSFKMNAVFHAIILSMIALMKPPMIGVMVPFQHGQKSGFRTGSKLWFFTPFQPAIFDVFLMGLFLGGDRSGRAVALTLQHNGIGAVA